LENNFQGNQAFLGNIQQSLDLNNLNSILDSYANNLNLIKKDVYFSNNYNYFSKLFVNQNNFNVKNNTLNYITTLESFDKPERISTYYLVEKVGYLNLNFKKSLEVFFQKNTLTTYTNNAFYSLGGNSQSVQNKVNLFFNVNAGLTNDVKINFFKNEVRLNKFLIETHFNSFKGND